MEKKKYTKPEIIEHHEAFLNKETLNAFLKTQESKFEKEGISNHILFNDVIDPLQIASVLAMDYKGFRWRVEHFRSLFDAGASSNLVEVATDFIEWVEHFQKTSIKEKEEQFFEIGKKYKTYYDMIVEQVGYFNRNKDKNLNGEQIAAMIIAKHPKAAKLNDITKEIKRVFSEAGDITKINFAALAELYKKVFVDIAGSPESTRHQPMEDMLEFNKDRAKILEEIEILLPDAKRIVGEDKK